MTTDGATQQEATVLPHGAYAGLVSRVVALLIDVLVLVLGSAAVYLVLVGGSGLMLGGTPTWVRTAASVTIAVVPTAYFSLAWWLTGQTAGDYVMGVTVAGPGAGRMGIIRSLLRALAGLALAPVWLVGMITILLDRRRRALLDMVFGTVVLYGGAPRH